MEWVQIEDSKYDINREGQIRSRKWGKERILKPRINKDGYAKVEIYSNGKRHNKFVHRLLAKQFIENPEQKPYVDHMDRNTSNNNLSNLRWATRSENNRNRIRKGCIYKTRWDTWEVKVINLEGKYISKTFKTKEEANQFRIDNLVQYIIT